jgi:N-acetylglutamate synthase-like GNAT family acetyltransferase
VSAGPAPVEWRRGEYLVSCDPARLDLDAAFALLRETHWGEHRPRDVLARAVAGSIAFGLYDGTGRLVGFARVVTDGATVGYWTDVVVDATLRGQGLGQWLCECMLAHPALQGLYRILLLTRDAASLYARLGFTEGPAGLAYMERLEHRGGGGPAG